MIPAEAVEAAAEVIALGEMEKTHYLKVAHSALEAAAPHMLADAWDEGHAAGRDYQGDGWNSDAHNPAEDNPYKSQP